MDIASEPTTRTLALSVLNAIACVSFTATGLLGIVDGPEAVHALFMGRFLAMSQFLDSPIIVTYLVLVAVVAIVGFFLPWGFAAMASITREKGSRFPPARILVASCYAVTTPLAFIPLVHVIMLWATWSPVQLVHLLDSTWSSATYYGAGLVAVIGLLASIACFKKVAGLSTPRALLPSLGTLVLLIISILLVVKW
nr:hypothetical protein [Candidatus Sigynarchaeum springense]